MSGPVTRVRFLFWGMVIGLLAGVVVQTGSRPGSALDGVAGLEKRVSLSETKIPLGELVQKVSVVTGVPLAATREVADEPVAVVVTECSARELLQQTASLLDFQWRRKAGEGVYEIGQDPAARAREERLGGAMIEAAERQFRIEVARHVELASLSPEQLEAFSQRDGAPGPEAAPAAFSEPLRMQEEREWRERARIARDLVASPVAHLLGRFLGTLSPSHWKRLLREGRPLVFSTHPAPGEPRLPAAMVRELRRERPRMFTAGAPLVAGSPEVEQQLRQREKDLQDDWAEATAYRVTLQTNARELCRGAGLLRLTATAAPLGSGSSDATHEGGWGTSLHVEAVPEAPCPPILLAASDALQHDPVFGAPRSLDAEIRRLDAAPGAPRRGRRRLSDLLPALARAYETGFLSDAYSGSPRLAGVPTGEAIPLGALLARWASASHQWDRQGSLVRLRSRSWHLDRPREVPLRLLRRWQRLCDVYGALPLSEWSASVAGLRESQLEGLAEVAAEMGLPPDFRSAGVVAPALRFYASLSPEQRQALDRDATLLLAKMEPRQRDLFLAALADGGEGASATAAATLCREAGFSLSRSAFARIRERQGESVQYRLEPVATPEVPKTVSRLNHLVRAPAGASPSRHLVTQVTLQFRLAPGVLRSVPVITAAHTAPAGDRRSIRM